MLRNYEILFLLSQREDIYKSSLKTIQKLFEEIGIKVIQDEDLGVKPLAYPIKKHAHGRYHVFYVTLESTDVKKLEAELSLSEEILRYLILEIDNKAKEFLFNKDYKHYHHRKAAEYSRKREEAKAEDTEAKTEGTEAKAEGTEAKTEGTEAKTEGTEAKVEDTEAETKENTTESGNSDPATEPVHTAPTEKSPLS